MAGGARRGIAMSATAGGRAGVGRGVEARKRCWKVGGKGAKTVAADEEEQESDDDTTCRSGDDGGSGSGSGFRESNGHEVGRVQPIKSHKNDGVGGETSRTLDSRGIEASEGNSRDRAVDAENINSGGNAEIGGGGGVSVGVGACVRVGGGGGGGGVGGDGGDGVDGGVSVDGGGGPSTLETRAAEMSGRAPPSPRITLIADVWHPDLSPRQARHDWSVTQRATRFKIVHSKISLMYQRPHRLVTPCDAYTKSLYHAQP